MSRELVREAHHASQLLRKTGDESAADILEGVALELSACRQAKTNAQRDNQRLATLNACQDALIGELRASVSQMADQLALHSEGEGS